MLPSGFGSVRRAALNSECSAINPRYSLGHGAERFPRNRIAPMAELSDGNFRAFLLADQHRFGTGLDTRDISHVDDGLIHGHTPEDRTAPSMNKDLGAIAGGAGNPIGVTGAKNGYR